MKTVTIPFDLELAKKIQNKEVEGNIVDGEGTEYEIVKWDAKGDYPLIATFYDEEDNYIRVNTFTGQGTSILVQRPTVLDFMRGKVDVNIQETYVDSILVKRDTIITYKNKMPLSCP